MPFGGGSHGGGGFSGGGISGYGGHHHHHYSHHRHYSSRGGGNNSWGLLALPINWAVFSTIIIIVVVVTPLAILSSVSSPSGNNIYASRDTVSLRYSSQLCDSLGISGSGFSAEQVQVSLYLLEDQPTSTREELISFSRTPTINRKFLFWFFHLVSNSRIMLTACTRSGSSATFFFIKGFRNFQNWVKRESRNYESRLDVSNRCPSDRSNDDVFFQYDVQSDDQYYMIYEAKDVLTLQLTFNITQVLYTPSSDIIADNCSVLLRSSDACSLPVAYASSYRALLQLEPIQGSTIDWDASNEVRVSCHPRAWVYVVVSLCSVVAIILLAVGVPLAIYAYCVRDKIKDKWNNLKDGFTDSSEADKSNKASIDNIETSPM